MDIFFDDATLIRTLVKENGETVNISDNALVQYTGLYYPDKNNICPVGVECCFLGKIRCHKYHHTFGILGIYIEPIAIDEEKINMLNTDTDTENSISTEHTKIASENNKIIWSKIVNFDCPTTKYYLYPHLLINPKFVYVHSFPIDTLHTVINIDSTYLETCLFIRDFYV